MRLIDADAFDSTLADGEKKARKSRKYVLESAINTIRGNLAKMPTIETPSTEKTQLSEEDATKDATFDCISRQAAIEWCLEGLNNMPSAQPEVLACGEGELIAKPERTGRWIPHPNKEFKEWDVCTACGIGCKRREYGIQDGHEWVTEEGYDYCPHCGARMEGTK